MSFSPVKGRARLAAAFKQGRDKPSLTITAGSSQAQVVKKVKALCRGTVAAALSMVGSNVSPGRLSAWGEADRHTLPAAVGDSLPCGYTYFDKGRKYNHFTWSALLVARSGLAIAHHG